MPQNSKKNYLSIAKQTRGILNADVPVDVQKMKEQSIDIKNIKSNKEAIAISAFWLSVARSQGEDIKKSDIEKLLNKLKGKNNSSALSIRQTLNNALYQISNQDIRNILTNMDQKKMATAIAETVLQKVGTKNTVKQITQQNEDNGWAKFGIALFIVLAAKFFTKK